jgi:hypothetical protein
VYILDQPDVQDAAGYHDEKNDLPYGKVFVNPVLENGGAILIGGPSTPNAMTVAQTLSHEVFELLADLYANTWWSLPSGDLVAGEVCDPVQNNILRVKVGQQIVGYSDWILPKWTDSQAKVGPFNHMKTVSAPFTIDKGGYMITLSGGSVQNVFGELVPQWVQDLKTKSSRLVTRKNKIVSAVS